jgi:hypothetical protein
MTVHAGVDYPLYQQRYMVCGLADSKILGGSLASSIAGMSHIQLT